MPEDLNEYVRVKDNDTGAHLTITRAGLPHGNYTKLKGAAVDPLTLAVLPPEYGIADPSEDGGYQSLTKDELNAEIDRRNSQRGEEAPIEVASPGNKPDLIAALQSDDNKES